MRSSRSRVRWQGKPLAVVLFSGGLDSAVTLARAIEDGCDCYPLFFDYGQTNECELDAAMTQLRTHFGEPYLSRMKVVDLTYQRIAPSCAMLNGGKGDFSNVEDITVPNRFVVFMSLAGAYATELAARYIYVGCQGYAEVSTSSPFMYDGSNPYLMHDMEVMLQRYSADRPRQVFIIAPLFTMKKQQIVEEAIRLNVPWKTTYSCQKGTNPPCGDCRACRAMSAVVIPQSDK